MSPEQHEAKSEREVHMTLDDRINAPRCKATGLHEPCRHHYATTAGQSAGGSGCKCFESSSNPSLGEKR